MNEAQHSETPVGSPERDLSDWSAVDAAKYAQRTIEAWNLLGGDGSPTLAMAKVHAEDVLTAIEVANRLARLLEDHALPGDHVTPVAAIRARLREAGK